LNQGAFPSFAKAELSKLHFTQALERWRDVSARVSMVCRVSFSGW